MTSVAAGVGTLLVAGVEYSHSEELSTGVGTEETDALPSAEALLGLPRGRLAVTVAGGSLTPKDDFLGRPLGRLGSRTRALGSSGSSEPGPTKFLEEADRVSRVAEASRGSRL